MPGDEALAVGRVEAHAVEAVEPDIGRLGEARVGHILQLALHDVEQADEADVDGQQADENLDHCSAHHITRRYADSPGHCRETRSADTRNRAPRCVTSLMPAP
jgi:hypothetical protein